MQKALLGDIGSKLGSRCPVLEQIVGVSSFILLGHRGETKDAFSTLSKGSCALLSHLH